MIVVYKPAGYFVRGKAALWTVILAGMAPADVFNLKHIHHSQLSIIALQLKIAHYL
jgi:hypothetical protein